MTRHLDVTMRDMLAAAEHVKPLGRCPPEVTVHLEDSLPVRMPDGRKCHWQWFDERAEFNERAELHVSPLLLRLLGGGLSFADAFKVCEELDP